MTTTYQVPLVTATQASLDNFNNPLRYIQTALNSLWDRTSLIYNKSAILLYDQPVSASAAVGDLVYYNTAEGQFAPALALLQAQTGAQGQSVQAQCARVLGIIIAINGATCTLLCGGIYKDGAVADACLGINAVPGTYYLSPFVAGKAVLDPQQNLRQPVLQYMGDGKLSLSIFYMAHDGHQHASAVLDPAKWVADTIDGQPTGTYTYDTQSDSAVQAMGQLSQDTTALFVDGTLQTWNSVYFITTDGSLQCGTVPSTESTYILFNHYPLAYGAPVVRDVVSQSSLFQTSKEGGIVHITPQPYNHTVAAQRSGSAIQQLGDGTAELTPVITEIQPGVGVSVHTTATGIATISNSALDAIYADATLINLNGAVHVQEDGLLFIVFPAGRQTSINMYYPVSYVPQSTAARAFVWAQHTGGAAQPAVTVRFIPNTQTATELPTSQAATAVSMSMPQTAAASAIRTVSSDYITITQPGYLCATIQMTPASAVKVLRQGFIVMTDTEV